MRLETSEAVGRCGQQLEQLYACITTRAIGAPAVKVSATVNSSTPTLVAANLSEICITDWWH